MKIRTVFKIIILAGAIVEVRPASAINYYYLVLTVHNESGVSCSNFNFYGRGSYFGGDGSFPLEIGENGPGNAFLAADFDPTQYLQMGSTYDCVAWSTAGSQTSPDLICLPPQITPPSELGRPGAPIYSDVYVMPRLFGTTQYGGDYGYGTVYSVNADGSDLTTLYSFSQSGGDGGQPLDGLLITNNTIYGTASSGGANGNGSIFTLNTDGSGYTTLYSFGCFDGGFPAAGLTLSGSTLYGTTYGWYYCGSYGNVFQINTNGSNFTNLCNFPDQVLADPAAGLTLSGSTLYGVTVGVYGAIFSINTDGGDSNVVYTFDGVGDSPQGPAGGLVVSGGVIYGTTYAGGSGGDGTVFSVNTDGTDFTVLHGFDADSNGANPVSALVLSGSTLYGTTAGDAWDPYFGFGGGDTTYGSVFQINTDGTGFSTLKSFSSDETDGAFPIGGLLLIGPYLYGTEEGTGTIFRIDTTEGAGYPFTTVLDGLDTPAGGLTPQ